MQTIATPESLLLSDQFEDKMTAGSGRVGRESVAEKPLALSEKPSAPSTGINNRFGTRLRELRRERNLTQLRMATEFGIDRSFISDVERGRKSISLPMLEVIALGMKITLSELLRGI